HVLRLKDAIHPRDATTPVRRACYAAQLLLTGDTEPEQARSELLLRIEELSRILTDPDSRRLLDAASEALIGGRFYQCLKALRTLIPREDRLLAVRPS
ncbi:MAG: flagellar biosynthesis repressor FlbT, partial [Erythrobacter sp.]|nr:flagellar biosynthesis repressor FlbT [Erythrobacter sp.]